MLNKKIVKNNRGQAVVQMMLGGALIIAVFFVGYLWNKLQTIKTSENSEGTETSVEVENKKPSTEGSGEKTAKEVAEQVGISEDALDNCLNSGYGRDAVADQVALAKKVGVQGTPGSFLLDTKTGNIARIPGAVPVDYLTALLDKMSAEGYEPEEKIDLAPVIATDHIRGDASARMLLVEYSDYECSFCRHFHKTLTELMSKPKYKIGWVYRHFPLPMHAHAQEKAEVAECVAKVAGDKAFWEYTDALLATD